MLNDALVVPSSNTEPQQPWTEPSTTLSTEITETIPTEPSSSLETTIVTTTTYRWSNLKTCCYAPLMTRRRLDDDVVDHEDQFTKSIKWSPDGTCLLTCGEDRSLHLYELPHSAYSSSLTSDTTDTDSQATQINPVFSIHEHDTVYDYAWYPYMNSSNPSTCLFATTSKDTPIHLWNAFTGKLAYSYIPWKDPDCLEAAISIQFNNDGSKLYSGFKKNIKIFDLQRPGDDYVEFDTFIKRGRNQSRQNYFPGLPGIVSCIAFDRSRQSGFYAVATYNGNIGLFDEANDDLIDILPYPQSAPLRGITQLQFSPDGSHLFAGYRKSEYIIGWDLRTTTAVETYSLHRPVNSNQRYTFDIDRSGRYLITGGQDGVMLTYDLAITGNTPTPIATQPLTGNDNQRSLNSVQFHPYLDIIAASTGERVFNIPDDDEAPKLEHEHGHERSLTPKLSFSMWR
ncbi:hypothetical protein SAMD00019534_017320 [Acytostelium subglobosum LB1]|uniref:hypothetical protein n=1 Tax=Acytostelium subglobosum LB1 TaxID=1410327 RepID=UPI00064487B9|nr:hypothetical protein SAMD00019534_017320 [Acytostelium subglobosum LB1]GAM18557.1 hypothetical protein SAMD00019534_017320 [Acytostelium subglobosum LB1]|eukprot:XP_012757777.1 hypothetical protein SAMD00019534_017320 [Acytostelium subglobosum LB1]